MKPTLDNRNRRSLTRLVRWLNRITSPEGCTAVDARKLREFNHGLGIENHRLRQALAEIALSKPQADGWCRAAMHMRETARAATQPGLVQPAGSDAVGSVQPGTCDGCHEPNDYVLTLVGGVHLCRGCLESEHPNAG